MTTGAEKVRNYHTSPPARELEASSERRCTRNDRGWSSEQSNVESASWYGADESGLAKIHSEVVEPLLYCGLDGLR